MRTFTLLIALTPALLAQDIAPKDSERDPVLSALLEAEEEATASGPSVTVDLAPAPILEDSEAPVLVTGSPPPGADLNAEEPPTPEEISGVRVEVEAGSSDARVNASEIRLLAPFPAKPLSRPPAGWKLIHPHNAPPFSKTVELANGNAVTLSIRPHVLVPDADGEQVFNLKEPGFDAAHHYAQKDTIGAILADSIMGLDENSDRLGEAAKRLDELLTSLPAPAPKASPIDQP
ncbi:MAG: hypothetical protein AAGI48_13090 [Verrucomicrobiota bacterium]